ncbi:hypothetical protein [Glycomyces sp. NPDC021274]|uniref:hypothetical protein n=1 Tax=Glycomyces sp. NPDC021274 TaxID=3155120 RepID=UPI0033FD91A6
MGWTKINDLNRPHRCRKPRATRRHGHNSQWTCDTCGKKWELHRHVLSKHWNPYGAFCGICGPGAGLIWPKPKKPGQGVEPMVHRFGAAPIESPDQPEPIEPGNVTSE